MDKKGKRKEDFYEEEPSTFEIQPDDVKKVPEDSDDDMTIKIDKINDFEQRCDGIKSNFQSLSEKINKNIDEIENKLLAFDASCEEDLIAMNESLSATKETKTKVAEQIRDLEEKRKSLEDNLKITADNVGELENRVHLLEESHNIERIEKIDAFMSQKADIQNLLIQNAQEIDRQKSEALDVQETIQFSEDNLKKISERKDDLDAFVADAQKEYDNIRELIDKATKEFDQYVDSQREQIQQIGDDFNQHLKSFEQEHQRQIKAMAADELDRIKAEVQLCENDALEQMNQTTAKLQDDLKEGKQTLSNQTNSGIREMEAAVKQTKSDMAKKLSEIELAHQEQLKVQKTITDDKNTLDKNLKVNKWMMIINVMVMVLTVTVLFLSVFF